MGLLNPIDVIYYCPHIAYHANTSEEVITLMEDDDYAIASSLKSFLLSNASDPTRIQVLPMSSDVVELESDGIPSMSRSKFYVWEIVRDVLYSVNHGPFKMYSPDNSETIGIHPCLDSVITPPWITVPLSQQQYLVNFYVGTNITITSPAGAMSVHEVHEIKDNSMCITNLYETGDWVGAYSITGVVSKDTLRVAKVHQFQKWRSLSSDAPISALETFNDTLYRILYTPADPQLDYMSGEELHENYLQHPGRIGTTSEIEWASNTEIHRVESQLIVDPGAQLTFSNPFPGSVTGVLNETRIGFDIPHPDTLVPTFAAVKRLLQASDGVVGGGVSTSISIPGIMYAGTTSRGVHMPTSLDTRDVHCYSMDCRTGVSTQQLNCKRGQFEDVSSSHLDATTAVLSDTLYASNGHVDVKGSVDCDRLDAAEIAVAHETAGTVHIRGHLDSSAIHAGSVDASVANVGMLQVDQCIVQGVCEAADFVTHSGSSLDYLCDRIRLLESKVDYLEKKLDYLKQL